MRERARRFVYACLGLLILGFCFVFGYLYVIGLGPVLAQAVAPPVYPNSQLVSQEEGGGSGWWRVSRVYKTDDGLKTVQAFMEREMPGFEPERWQARGQGFGNGRCNDSWLGRYVAQQNWRSIDGKSIVLPCASVHLWVDPQHSEQTLIEVELSWVPP
jgi:hypothetical protein